MSLYNPEGTPPIIPAGVARVERHLPYPGDILVREGQRVEPEDIVAQALVPATPQIVNVAQALAIPAAQITRALRREVGNKITRGDELARTGAPMFGRTCAAPADGIISAVDPELGYVTLTPDPEEFHLPATIRGIVMEVHPLRGVVIETPAAQVYGAFGIGETRNGVLRLMLTDDAIQPEQIDARSAYSIIITNGSITAAALRRAVQEQVRGVIVGSMAEEEVRAFLGWSIWQHMSREQRSRLLSTRAFDEQDMRSFLHVVDVNVWYTGIGTWQFPNLRHAPDPGLTLLVTEGFGQQQMSQPIFELLSDKDRQEAVIDGTTNLRRWQHRPRVIVPLSRTGGDTEPVRPQIQPGSQVRLLDSAHIGEVATVRSVSTIPRRIATGVRTLAVEVVQEEDTAFWVPRTAVEVLG